MQLLRVAALLVYATALCDAQQTQVHFYPIAKLPPASTARDVYYVTDRRPSSNPKNYTAERSENGSLSYGKCIVTIPRAHVLGSLEDPLLPFLEDGAKHVILVSAESQADAVFYRFVNEAISHSDRRDAFIFIHGFNTTFQDAARRTGQIAYDLKFEGAAVFYTWPSQGNKSGYLVDQNNAEWTVPHLVTFLREFQAKSGARKVSIIAHSTGARILTSALEHLNSDRSTAVRFSQIILAAPDIDKDIFLQLAKAVNHTADRITLYAPSKDWALRLSEAAQGYPRAGESGYGLTLAPGVDTVDATSVRTDLFPDILSHSYYAGPTVLADIFSLIKYDLPPTGRFGLTPVVRNLATYWEFHP